MQRLLPALFALVALTSMVSACGQKGPLYLPDADKPAAEQHAH